VSYKRKLEMIRYLLLAVIPLQFHVHDRVQVTNVSYQSTRIHLDFLKCNLPLEGTVEEVTTDRDGCMVYIVHVTTCKEGGDHLFLGFAPEDMKKLK
jgi:hypothetical protein